MRPRTLLALTLALASTLACRSEPEPSADRSEPDKAQEVEPIAAEPEPPPEPPAEPEPSAEPAPPPEPDPELDERKLALANVGRGAFDALKAGEFASLLALTPIDPGPLHDACPATPKSNRRELQARFDHCHETIDWDAVAEAQVFAGKPTGAPASGCEAGIEDYGRLQLFLHMNDATIWRVDFFGAVGRDGNAIGINGEVACHEVDSAPELK